MEEVDNYNVKRNTAAFVFTRNFEHLVLSAVTQLALPEPEGIFGKFRCASGHSGIIFYDLFRRVVRSYPVVKLLSELSAPLCVVFSEHDFTDPGAVPQKSVSFIGYVKRDTDL